MDSDEAPPPPYSAVDPLVGESSGSNASQTPQQSLLRLRGGNVPLRDTESRDGSSVSDESMPDNFVSAAAYFVDRPPTVREERNALHHYMTIYPRSQSKDFPRRPRCWNPRAEEITQQDWDTFLRYLFPPHLGLASASDYLPRQLRAQIQRDRKDRPQETDEQRRRRIAAVIDEWNQYFFEPRASRIMFVYVLDREGAPTTSLCPKCYPAATKSTQESQQQAAPQGANQPSALPTLPTLPGMPALPQAPAGGFYPATYPYPYPPMPQGPPPPHGPPAFFHPPHPPVPVAYPPYPPVPPQPPQPWGWNSRPYGSPAPNTGSSKGGPLGWFSQIASQAQKYGERITEQAQHYGRQVEEQAAAHGRWIEEQAGLKGKDVFSGFVRPKEDWPVQDPRYQAYYANYYNYPYPNHNTNNSPTTAANITPTLTPITAPSPTTTTTPSNNRNLVELPASERVRRASVDSASSDSSLTSIDSLSTTSDLSSSDLATVRAQLLSLNDHHDRELYKAAVDLRRQLDTLQESRRQARISGRSSPWGHGWGNHQQNQGYGRGSWGRWESPQEHQRSSAEKRAMKEEMKTTRKAFREVVRRAREEQREKRRNRRNRRRQERRSRPSPREETPQELPLEQRLDNLQLERNREDPSTVRSSGSFPSTARSISSSEVSDISPISTPSPASSHVNVRDTANSSVDEEKMSRKDIRKQAKDQQKQTEKQCKDNEKKRKDDKKTGAGE